MKIINNKKGLTLIEMMLVLALLAIVMSIVGRRAISTFFRGQKDAAKIMIQQVQGQLDRYRFDCNRYPSTDQGIKALATAPATPPACPSYDPSGYLDGKKTPPKDPWKNEFFYSCEDGMNYVLKSFGPDGVEGGGDDISSEDQ
ncbi:MAG: type II secretion system major pseudopilin GspG [Proteobacteria bacterium]|nr:type II secretion system major pseudopilin GspG [Pseudomonadota bacterium]